MFFDVKNVFGGTLGTTLLQPKTPRGLAVTSRGAVVILFQFTGESAGSSLLKHILVQTANGAVPGVGQILKGGAGGNAAIGIANGGIVFVSARAYILHGCVLQFL